MLRCMKRTNIYLDEAQTASLDTLAHQQGVSRAEVIRQLLDRALTSTDDHRGADLQAIEESFGVLGDVAAPQRGRGEREEHLDRMWRRAR